MVEWFYSAPWTLARLHAGPLGRYTDDFAALLQRRGYARSTIRAHLRLVGDLSQWLESHSLGVEALSEEILRRSLEHSPRGSGFLSANKAALWALLAHLRKLEVIPLPIEREDESAVGRVLRDYKHHLEQDRGLSPATVSNYLPLIQRFLTERFGEEPLHWHEISPSDIVAFVTGFARSYAVGRVRLLVTALRSFFRFLRWRHDLPTDLAAAVPSVAQWRSTGVPKSLEPAKVQLLLESCDRETLVGRRDYAMLLLFARLGLRAGEVVAMRLEDLDWRAGEVVVRGKGAQRDRLPMPRDVGEALVAYLQRRPAQASTRQVFVRVRAPLRGLAQASSASVIVHRALARAGLDAPARGPHMLRHSLACEMLRHDASMAETAQILRHRSPTTTEVYAKVDLRALHQLAQPWPGSQPS